ncbi:hypothetical protein VNO78_30548 [Psophocarpus tetragonolobus]|uniref:RING-type E3 ubiquitin transferase n=1 Tax=Psophocarpus tetragonolobus TaxID=3891 RepID=A0AAN9RX98_PSOTE
MDGVVGSRKGMNNVFRDTANTRDPDENAAKNKDSTVLEGLRGPMTRVRARKAKEALQQVVTTSGSNNSVNGQICSKLACSSRANLPKVSRGRSAEKCKSFRSSFQSSSSSKEVIGSSSRMISNPAKRLIEPQKTLSSQFETDSSETSSVLDEPETSDLIPQPDECQRRPQAGASTESSNVILMEVGSSSAVSTRSQRNLNQIPRLCGQEIKTTGTGSVRPAVSSRYGLRNLRCNSISDVVPAGCSSSDSSLNRRKDTIKRGIYERGSSSTFREKNITGPSLEGRNSASRNGASISDSRRSRNIPSNRNTSMASVRTQRPISGHARRGISRLRNENPVVEISESPVMVALSPYSGDLNAPSFSYHTSMETPLSGSSSYGRPGNRNEQLCGVMPVSLEEDDITHSLTNQERVQHYNMGVIDEVLLALERIEQDSELTDEQILFLETNLFMNGFNFYDHHRDMRLDIDNMSYEELLALEERMGTVSTALPEEALTECLKRSIYQPASSDDADESCNEDKDDIKCCICQEEYVVGDEIGSLQCEHKFHVVCIQEWLGVKNWCPICKVSAAQSNSSSPH